MMQQENRPEKPGINDPEYIFKTDSKPLRYCPNCKQSVESNIDVCPECKHYLNENKTPAYQPLSTKTARKIRLILGGIIIIAFIILAATGVIKLDCMSN